RVVARRVNDARSRLAELEQRQIVKPPRQLTFQGLAAAHDTPLAYSQDEQLVRAEQVAMENRLKPISLAITARDKLLITGPNGAGKSTLLNLVAGQLQPSQGQVSYREGEASAYWLKKAISVASLAEPHRKSISRPLGLR